MAVTGGRRIGSGKWAVTWFAALQWLSFMFANTVVIPLSVGSAFHLTPAEISGSMARCFILTGLACVAQGTLGHRLPLMEGPSGFWWSVTLSLAGMSAGSPAQLAETGGSLAVGMIAGSALVAVLACAGLHRALNRLFTPVVMAVLLLLLAAQLVETFAKGMLGVAETGIIQPGAALLSVCVAGLVALLTIGGRGAVSNFSILIGIAAGWPAYILAFGQQAAAETPRWQEIAHMFAWGPPADQPGIIAVAVLSCLLNTTNTVATLRAAEPLFGVRIDGTRYRRAFWWSSLLTAAAGWWSLVGYVPYTSSIGFLRTTRLLDRAPFLLGGLMFTLLGLVPPLAGWFANMPLEVGDAVLFIAYLQLFGSALQNLEGIRFNHRTVFRIALPVLTGISIQTLPAEAFRALPGFAQTIGSNGMLVGILLAVALEGLIPWARLESQTDA
ncbi:MAG: uracil/xanthine transporter [Alicyclobacillus sp.]|nr:uracil/xanthine transporter [Alicyclobacillus sp.]